MRANKYQPKHAEAKTPVWRARVARGALTLAGAGGLMLAANAILDRGQESAGTTEGVENSPRIWNVMVALSPGSGFIETRDGLRIDAKVPDGLVMRLDNPAVEYDEQGVKTLHCYTEEGSDIRIYPDASTRIRVYNYVGTNGHPKPQQELAYTNKADGEPVIEGIDIGNTPVMSCNLMPWEQLQQNELLPTWPK